MKVYIVTPEPFPHGMAATNRILCYAKALIFAGVDCEIIVYHRTEKYGSVARNVEGQGVFEGVTFRYIGFTPLRHRNPFIRKFFDWKDKRNTIGYLEHNMKKGDVVFCYMRESSFVVCLQNFCHRHGYKIVRELCEYPYATKKLDCEIYKKSAKYFNTVFKKFDGSICISEALYNIATKYHPNGFHIKVPILVDESEWNYENVTPKKFDYPFLFHSGALYQQKDGIVDVLNSFADALPFLPKGTKYFFTGNIDNSRDKDLINATIKDRKLTDNVLFLGYLPKQEMIQYMKGAAAFVIFKNDNLQNRYCFATKLGEYLLSGNPVITTTVGESKYFLKDKESAYFVEPGDVKGLTETIVYCINNLRESSEVGKQGRLIAIEHFFTKTQSKVLENYFRKISNSFCNTSKK